MTGTCSPLLVFEVRNLLAFTQSFNLSKATWLSPSAELSVTVLEELAATITECHLQDWRIVVPRHTTASACFWLKKDSIIFLMLVTGLNCGSAVKTTSIILHTQHPVSTKGQIAWEDLSDFWFSVASLQFSDSATYKIIKAACFATASRCSNKTCCIKAINKSWAGT